MGKLLYVGQQVADNLADQVIDNLDRYRAGDFLDLEAKGDWRIPLSIEAEISGLSNLNQTISPDSEIENSILVGNVFKNLNPALARENRIWIRLSHIECIEYSRQRWLNPNANDHKLAEEVRKHFFAQTLTGCRDDHAISRLWWNHHIAKQIWPESPERALKVILARADIRLNFLERPSLAARPSLGRGIISALERSNELLRREDLFRKFMKILNLSGAGIAFEVWTPNAIDRFIDRCLADAVKQ